MLDKTNRKIFVTPGFKLGVIEEFTAGQGTFEKNGSIYSEITGYANLDSLEKTATVNYLTKNPILPSRGSIVTGIVSNIQGKAAILDIYKVNGHPLEVPFVGALHVSRCSQRFEKGITDVCRISDLIKAKVVDDRDGFIKLNTIDRDLGVIRALCSNCGNILIFRKNVLKCKECGNFEKRKISEDYFMRDSSRGN